MQSSVGHAPADSLKREHCLKIPSPQPGIGPGGKGKVGVSLQARRKPLGFKRRTAAWNGLAPAPGDQPGHAKRDRHPCPWVRTATNRTARRDFGTAPRDRNPCLRVRTAANRTAQKDFGTIPRDKCPSGQNGTPISAGRAGGAEIRRNQAESAVLLGGFDVSRLFPSRNGLETSVMAHLNSNGRWPPRPPVSCPALKPARRVSRSAL